MNDNAILNYRIIGNGYPVVFLHGYMDSLSMWLNFDLENAAFKSILIDLPGHGDSALLDDNEIPSMDFMAKKVKEIIDSLKIDEYHVVGHSMGGYVSLALKKIDNKCRKVVLMSSNFWEDSPEKKKDRIRVADIVFKNKDLFITEAIPGLFYKHMRQDEVVKDAIKNAKKMESSAIAYSALAMRNREDMHELVSEFKNDFLILQGKNDPLIAPKKMKAEIGNADLQLKILDNSGHMPHIEETELTFSLISEFLV